MIIRSLLCLIRKDYDEFSEYIAYTLGALFIAGSLFLVGYALFDYFEKPTSSVTGFEWTMLIVATIFFIILGIGLCKRKLIAYIITIIVLSGGIIACLVGLFNTIGTNEHVAIAACSGGIVLMAYWLIGFIISIKKKCYNK